MKKSCAKNFCNMVFIQKFCSAFLKARNPPKRGKIMKKISLILALLFIVSLFAACSDTGGTADVTTSPPNSGDVAEEITTEPADALEARKLVSDDLTTQDFGGTEFRISATDKYAYEMDVETMSGDVCDDAVYERNRAIEERFNVKIKNVLAAMASNDNHGVHPDFIMKSVMAGDNDFELAALYVYTSEKPILAGCYLNWHDIPHINFDKPWWVDRAVDAFTINGKMYIAAGDLSVTTLTMSYVYLFNKQLAENYGVENIYGTVSDGKWTIDYLMQASKDIYEDMNGDGTADKTDRYGFIGGTVTDLDAYLPSFDQPLVEFKNGLPEVVINTEKTIAAVEKLYNLYYNNGTGTFVQTSYHDRLPSFKVDQALFVPSRMYEVYDELRDMTSDYGIIPYPKWDEAQKDYLTNTLDNWSALGVPKTVVDLDFVGTIIEALTAESYKTVMPAYYDVALKVKFSRDLESIEMLDIITAGRTYDFSILHGSDLQGLPYVFRSLIGGKNSDFTSKYASIEKAMNNGLQKVINAYSEIE